MKSDIVRIHFAKSNQIGEAPFHVPEPADAKPNKKTGEARLSAMPGQNRRLSPPKRHQRKSIDHPTIGLSE